MIRQGLRFQNAYLPCWAESRLYRRFTIAIVPGYSTTAIIEAAQRAANNK
jgi:hypothetical protein